MAFCGWVLAACGALGVCYGVNFAAFMNDGDEKSSVENAFYMGFHKLVWGMSLGWVIFACAKGFGGK